MPLQELISFANSRVTSKTEINNIKAPVILILLSEFFFTILTEIGNRRVESQSKTEKWGSDYHRNNINLKRNDQIRKINWKKWYASGE